MSASRGGRRRCGFPFRETFLSVSPGLGLSLWGRGEDGSVTIIKSSLSRCFLPWLCWPDHSPGNGKPGWLCRPGPGGRLACASAWCWGRREKRHTRPHTQTHTQYRAERSLFFHTHVHSLSHIWDWVCTNRHSSLGERRGGGGGAFLVEPSLPIS